MPENPLLPNDELRKLYALTRRCASLESEPERAGSSKPQSRAALLAGTTLQLRPGDALVSDKADRVLAGLAPSATSGSALLPDLGRETPTLLLATALAAGLRTAASDHLVFSLVRAGSAQPQWQAALAWAQERQLPVVLACADSSGSAAFLPPRPGAKAAFDWASVHRHATHSKLPILTVDGEDAVAVYRCMQESVLRARSGAGPALLWAVLPSPRQMRANRPKSEQPLGRLASYLRSRRIPLARPA